MNEMNLGDGWARAVLKRDAQSGWWTPGLTCGFLSSI